MGDSNLLRSPDPGSTLHIYYLFENYANNQVRMTKAIQGHLSKLGRQYGRDVTLYMPDPNSKPDITRELREKEKLWHAVHHRLPGIFILKQPLEDYNHCEGESFFVPFANENGTPTSSSKEIAELIQRVTKITDDQLAWEYNAPCNVEHGEGVLVRLLDSLEVKPGFFGIKLDLKRLLRIGR